MLFDITHITQYNYDEPVRESVMDAVDAAARGAPARTCILNFNVDIDPLAQEGVFYVKLVGKCGPPLRRATSAHAPDHHHPFAGRDLDARPSLPGALDQTEWDRLAGELVHAECWEFLQPHGFAASTAKLRAFCEAHRVADLRQLDPLTALDRLSTVLYRGLDYERGVTGADSPIDEALEAGRGVCQDFAHIMITIARGWKSLPVTYSRATLRPAAPRASAPDPQATHAWVEGLPLLSLRWVPGLDPTSDILACDRHIPRSHRPGLFRRSAVAGSLQG